MLEKTTYILGVDPGSRKFGMSVIKVIGNRSPEIVETAQIQLDTKATMPKRLAQVLSEVQSVCDRYALDMAGLEEAFHGNNASSLIKLAQSRGVIMAVLGSAGIPVHEFSATHIKSIVTGGGKASKESIQAYVNLLYKPDRELKEDEADSLGIAHTCYVHFKSEKLTSLATSSGKVNDKAYRVGSEGSSLALKSRRGRGNSSSRAQWSAYLS